MQESMREWLSQLQLSENSSLCQMQLYRMLRDLRDNCKTLLSNLKVTRGWRTCGQSAADVFLHGRTLLRAMQVPFDRLLSGAPLESTLPLLEALWFMRDWLPKLASIGKHALLWAGFWQAEPSGRAGKSNLAHFAELTDHQTVHPTTELGQIIADGGELSGCYGNRLTSEFAANLWSIASMFFVRGMQFSGQGSVVALVNKKMEGARPLKDSVLAQYEIPTVGNAAWTTQWGAEVILIDLQGTCSDTSPYLRQRLATGLGGLWELYQQKHFTAEEFAQLSRPSWTCIDCGADSGCELDEQLAGVVRSRLEAKRLRDETVQRLWEAADQRNLVEVKRLLSAHPAPDVDFRVSLDFEMNHHARLNTIRTVGYTTLLHHAADQGQADLARLLLGAGADPNLKDEEGKTSLGLAAYSGHQEVAGLLLAGGADPNVKDMFGKTPLQLAGEQGHTELQRLLLSQGADPKLRAVAKSPAFWPKAMKVLRLLRQHGAISFKPF